MGFLHHSLQTAKHLSRKFCCCWFAKTRWLWQNLHNLCFVFHDDYWLRPIVQALSLSLLSPSVLLPQTLYIGIVRNVLINTCEYAKVLRTWNSFGLHTYSRTRAHSHLSLSLSKDIHFFADPICVPFDNVHQHMDPNEALTVWFKLFMKLAGLCQYVINE